MTNQDLMREYIRGEKTHGAVAHLGYQGEKLVNYSTEICEIDRARKVAWVNVRKYSPTTSKIQTQLLGLLNEEGYDVQAYEGNGAYMWNLGFQGAPRLKASDFRP